MFHLIVLNLLLDVLVSTKRVVARFADLTPDEVTDLFLCTHRIAPVLQREFSSTSLTIALQVSSSMQVHRPYCYSEIYYII